MTIYRGASADNECPLMVEKDLPSCGKFLVPITSIISPCSAILSLIKLLTG